MTVQFSRETRASSVVLSRDDRPRRPDPERRVSVVATRTELRLGHRLDGSPYVTLRRSSHYKGRTIKRGVWQDKTFSRWATDQAMSVSLTSDGAWLVRTWAGRRRRYYSLKIFAGDRPHHLRDVLDAASEHLPAPKPIWEVYPLLDHWLDRDTFERASRDPFAPTTAWASPGVRRAFAGAEDLHDVTRRLFGKTRYRRDLAKAVARAPLNKIDLAWQFRGLVPIDWLVAYLRSQQSGPPSTPNGLRPMLRTLDQQSLKNLLRCRDADSWTFGDILRTGLHGDAQMSRIKDWTDLHDVLAARHRAYTHLHQKRRRKTKLAEGATALNGITTGDLRIEVADHEDTLVEWACEMGNCISVYGSQMRRGASWLGGIYTSAGKLLGNFEVKPPLGDGPDSPPRLMQLLGKHNRTLPDNVRLDMEAHLRTHGVDVDRTYWGVGAHAA